MATASSRADLVFARAAIDSGLLTQETVQVCLAEQARLASQGQVLNLAQVCVWRQVLEPERARQLIADLKAQPGPGRGQASAPGSQQPAGPQGGVFASPGPAPAAPVSAGTGVGVGPGRGPRAVAAFSPQPPVSAASAIPLSLGEPVVTPDSRSGLHKALGIEANQERFEFGPYRIHREIARGGMGVIYSAEHKDEGQLVALKTLNNVENATEKQLKRFVNEAMLAKRIQHPGIVRIHDFGVAEDVPYIAMEMLTGEPLSDLLEERKLSREELLEILRAVCEAIHHAHEHGVVHRDLKPANILLRGDGTPVVTDFGLAKNLESQFQLTADGALVGTPLYLSPEQVAGKAKDVDGRCDVYGLGVIMYVILTKRLPFFGRNPYEVYEKILRQEPTPPREIDATITEDLQKVCLQALAKDREQRYASARCMAEDLALAMRAEPVRLDRGQVPEAVAAVDTPDSSSQRVSPAKLPPRSRSRSRTATRVRRRAPRADSKKETLIVVGAVAVAGLLFIAALAFAISQFF